MMRKRVLCLLCLCLLLLSGCSGNPVEIPPAQNTGRRAEEPDQEGIPSGFFEVSIAGKTIRLPMKLDELAELGFEPESPAEGTLPSDEFTETFDIQGNGATFQGMQYNPFDQEMDRKDCPLVYLSAREQVGLENGLGIGATQQEILNAYGSAEEGYLTEDVQWLLYGTGLTYALCFEIDRETDRVIAVDSYCIPLQEYEVEQP